MDFFCIASEGWNQPGSRTRHLMTRFAESDRVYVIAPPCFNGSALRPELAWNSIVHNLWVGTPRLADAIAGDESVRQQRALIAQALRTLRIRPDALWIDAAEGFALADQISAGVTVYDCAARGEDGDAATDNAALERALVQRAQLVFAADTEIARGLRALGARPQLCPDGVDVRHFERARHRASREAEDQSGLPRPRLGFLGAADALDRELVETLADAHPSWQLVMLAERSPDASASRNGNLHWLGPRDYAELPKYLVGWDVALLPLAVGNHAARTAAASVLACLAAGKPVVSTTVAVEQLAPFANGSVRVVDRDDFADGIEQALRGRYEEQLQAADACVAALSWRASAERMRQQVASAMPERIVTPATSSPRDARVVSRPAVGSIRTVAARAVRRDLHAQG